MWLDTTEPLSSTPLRRAVMAQDTGSAITGAVRADYFWGWGDDAEAQAGLPPAPTCGLGRPATCALRKR